MKLKENGLTVQVNKSSLNKQSVTFLGFVIDKDGLHVAKEKIEVVLNLKRPQNITDLRSILWLLNYYARFIQNFSDVVNPLNRLLQKGVVFKWDTNCEKAFVQAKRKLASKEVLTHYR